MFFFIHYEEYLVIPRFWRSWTKGGQELNLGWVCIVQVLTYNY
jgi:hypothetical protein